MIYLIKKNRIGNRAIYKKKNEKRVQLYKSQDKLNA